MYEVKFVEVGRGKKSWVATLPDMEERTVAKELHRAKAVKSRFPDVYVNPDGTGLVCCGYSKVGAFTWCAAPAGVAHGQG